MFFISYNIYVSNIKYLTRRVNLKDKQQSFVSEFSRLSFNLFCKTGEIRYFMLYKAVEDSSLDKAIENDREM